MRTTLRLELGIMEVLVMYFTACRVLGDSNGMRGTSSDIYFHVAEKFLLEYFDVSNEIFYEVMHYNGGYLHELVRDENIGDGYIYFTDIDRIKTLNEIQERIDLAKKKARP